LEAGEWLKEALLAWVGADADYYHKWAERITPPDPAEIPAGLLNALPSFEDPRLDDLPFSEHYLPITTKWLYRQPPQDMSPTPFCVTHAFQFIESVSKRKAADKWLKESLADLMNIDKNGVNARRVLPELVVISQQDLYGWARGRVFDCTFETSECCIPLDLSAAPNTHLNTAFLERELREYPDRAGVANVVEGVRLEADVELHSVLMWHLQSLPLAMSSVGKELNRMAQPPLRWYRFFEVSPPYWPIYFNGNGAVARKLEPHRHRRTTEGGGPRRPTFDNEGLRVLSLNQASKLRHKPRHFVPHGSAEEQAVFQRWLKSKGLPAPPEELAHPLEDRLRNSKFPHEEKPSTEKLRRDLTVLSTSSRRLGMPIYIRVADAKDYFSQLAMAPEDFRKLNLVFLKSSLELKSHQEAGNEGKLVFISERVLGFGCHAASNVAQRFSEMLLWMYRRRLTKADAQNLCEGCDPRPAFAEWRKARLRAQSKRGGRVSEHRLSELRLHAEHMYTDDAVFITVGLQRTLLSIKIWNELMQEINLIMAIPEKQFFGTWAPWLGLNFYSTLGLIVIPPAKMVRAVEAIQSTLENAITFDKYRALIGLLEHLRTVYGAKRNVMHGLYEPHDQSSRAEAGPADAIIPSVLMIKQLKAWLTRLASAAGVAVTGVIDGARFEAGLTVVITSDAANDDTAAGLGGFCHGFWWYLGLSAKEAFAAHITLLEFLAAAIGMLVFARYATRFARVVILSDAIATPYALSRESEKSPALRFAHYLLRQTAAFQTLAPRSVVAHLGGDKMVLADAVSRQLMDRLHNLGKQLRLRLTELPLPPEALELYHEVMRFVVENAGATRRPRKPRLALPPQPLGGPWRSLVLNVTRCEPCLDDDYVYGGRGGNAHAAAQGHAVWGNYAWGRRVSSARERDDAIATFRLHLLNSPALIRKARRELKGKRLGCFCAPADCHLHVLAEVANCTAEHLARLLEIHRGDAARRATARRQRIIEQDGERVHPHPGDLALWLQRLNGRLHPHGAQAPLAPTTAESGPQNEPHWLNALASKVNGRPSKRQATLAERGTVGMRPETLLSAHPADFAVAPTIIPSTSDGWQQKLAKRVRPAHYLPPVRQPTVPTTTFSSGDYTYRMVQPVEGARRRDSALREAGRQVARQRAARLAADTSEGAIGAALPFLEDIFMAADDLAEYGVNYNTNTKDAHAWDEWEKFCGMMQTNPMRTARMVLHDPERETILLAHFVLWIYPRLKPRSSSETWAKPASALAYPLAIIRIFSRWGVHLPKITAIRAQINGLMRVAVVVFGPRFLVPHRKEPLTLEMIRQVAAIEAGRSVGGRPWDPASTQAVQLLDMLCFLIVTGFRLAELVFHSSGEQMYLVENDVSAVIGGATLSDPTDAQWRAMTRGDYLVVVPPRSKTDQFGEVHCPYPCILPFEDEPLNAAKRLRDAALRRPCHGAARGTTPLFAANDGRPHSHSYLDGLLRAVLTATVGAQRAALYSWHSARIGLACALRAAGCPPDTIQLICRWMCPESLRVYALKGVSEHASWVRKAMDVTVDATRGTSIPIVSAADGLFRMQDELARSCTDSAAAAAATEPLERAVAIAPVRHRRASNLPPLPKRNPGLGALLVQANVVCPARTPVPERQRLLLVANPGLALAYTVPPHVLAAAGLAADGIEAPPADIPDAD